MQKLRHLAGVVALTALVFALATPGSAQSINDVYQVGYYNVGPGIAFHVINTGQIGSPIDAATNQGTVCADIYIFDTNQEMLSCCSCPITANGLTNIHSGRALTAVPFTTGVIKIVSDRGCDETNITAPVPAGLRAFQTNAQVIGATETLFQPAPLTATEQTFLGNTCSFVHYLGSGVGVCACGGEDIILPPPGPQE